MRSMRLVVVGVVLALAGAAMPARAAMSLDAWKGHVAIGYSVVESDTLAPGGSLSVSAGVDYPLASKWRLGPALSFDLLGSSSATRGSIRAGFDYSLFETAMLFSYLPSRGPVERWSFGPGIASPRADISVAAGGAGFEDLAVGEVKGEFALDATLMSRHQPVVAAGAELGVRVIPTSQGMWTLLTARLAVHF